MPVREPKGISSVEVSEAQQVTVRKMARALVRGGLSGAFGHCSLRLNDEAFLVCASRPMGLIRAGEVGTVVEIKGALPDGVFGEVCLHQQVYLRRPDIQAVCRFTSPNVLALSAMGLTPVARHGFGSYFYPEAPFFAGAGLVRDAQTAAEVVERMGDAPAIVVGVNGAVTAGTSAGQALALAWLLEEAARVELAVLASGLARTSLGMDKATARQRATWDGLTAARLWDHLCHGDPE